MILKKYEFSEVRSYEAQMRQHGTAVVRTDLYWELMLNLPPLECG
jgi:hypothetical protein